LRAIAVICVIFYHSDISGLFPAGFLGVDIFFTVSGFIITTLLLHEYQVMQHIDFRAFYVRRARRLFPSALALLLVVATLTPAIAPEALHRLSTDIPAALVYASNWWQIASNQSYFESYGRPPILQHLWSLAIEEQYYIVWPLFLVLLLRLGSRYWLGVASTFLALLSATRMAYLFDQVIDGGDPSRVYLGTDSHLMGLLVGSALACAWQHRRLDTPVQAHASASPPPLQAAGLVAAALLVLMVLTLNDSSALLYRGGFLAAAVLTAVLIVAAAESGSLLHRVLGSRWLSRIGTRSYALYLWHWPVFVWLRPESDTLQATLGTFGLRLLITVVCAELSHQLIERPFRTPDGNTLRPMQRKALWFGGAAAFSSACLVVMVPVRVLEMNTTESYFGQQFYSRMTSVPGGEFQRSPLGGLVLSDHGARQRLQRPWNAINAEAGGISAIGDSVLLGARDTLVRSIPGIDIDAQVGRQGNEGLKVVKDLRQQAALQETVVIHLGTNGYLSEPHFRELLRQLADRQLVVLINVHANRRWTSPNNVLIERVGRDFKNVVVVDWEEVAGRHPEYFAGDGIHLTSLGAKAMAVQISSAAGSPLSSVDSMQGARHLSSVVLRGRNLESHADGQPTPSNKPASEMAAQRPGHEDAADSARSQQRLEGEHKLREMGSPEPVNERTGRQASAG
jgi:peptidoglycan/LPS O-acetylase OafA/YrhL